VCNQYFVSIVVIPKIITTNTFSGTREGNKNYSACTGALEIHKVKWLFNQQERVSSLSLSLGYRTGKSGPQVHEAESSPAVADKLPARSRAAAISKWRGLFVSFLVRPRPSEMVAIETGISPAQHNVYIYICPPK
jgi:hypothetical protein